MTRRTLALGACLLPCCIGFAQATARGTLEKLKASDTSRAQAVIEAFDCGSAANREGDLSTAEECYVFGLSLPAATVDQRVAFANNLAVLNQSRDPRKARQYLDMVHELSPRGLTTERAKVAAAEADQLIRQDNVLSACRTASTQQALDSLLANWKEDNPGLLQSCATQSPLALEDKRKTLVEAFLRRDDAVAAHMLNAAAIIKANGNGYFSYDQSTRARILRHFPEIPFDDMGIHVWSSALTEDLSHMSNDLLKSIIELVDRCLSGKAPASSESQLLTSFEAIEYQLSGLMPRSVDPNIRLEASKKAKKVMALLKAHGAVSRNHMVEVKAEPWQLKTERDERLEQLRGPLFVALTSTLLFGCALGIAVWRHGRKRK